jgi:vacuolar-type H+-ATPase subunit I/STV1
MFIIGVAHIVAILFSRFIKRIFMAISFGFIGKNISWLFLVLGFQFGRGSFLHPSMSYWTGFITTIVISLIINLFMSQKLQEPDYERTISDCNVAFSMSSIVGMLIRLIF